MKKKSKKILGICILFALSFCAGSLVAKVEIARKEPESVAASSTGNWGLSFQEEGKPPVTDISAEELAGYDAYYAKDTNEKVLYLTFDAGFENGNTPAILDALKKHHATATFFVVGNYLNTSPDLVKRMVDEGHTVGNHTYHHPDMSKISTKETFSKEITDVEKQYKEITGKDMVKFYRPPQGKFSESNLKMAKEMGYKTFFWSLAYVDWDQNNQPTKEEAFDKLLKRVHPGAIVLLHSTSDTNAQILDELLTKWEEMGYSFQPLDALTAPAKNETAQHAQSFYEPIQFPHGEYPSFCNSSSVSFLSSLFFFFMELTELQSGR